MTSPKKTGSEKIARKRGGRKRWQEEAFQKGLHMLGVFVDREKSADVPVLHKEPDAESEDGLYPLGRWVANQRAKYHRFETNEEDIKSLESFPGWTWSAWDKDWPKAIRLLQQYQDREGHARCPVQHKESGYPLGAWVARQRSRYAAGRLSPERAKELESFKGCLGNWKRAQSEELWNAKFDALKRFVQEHGHANVPRDYADGDLGLGVWVNSIRSQKSRGTLSAKRTKLMESVPGWEWARSREEVREQGFSSLQAYVAANGHANVPRGFIDESGFRLGEWVGKRRTAYKNGKLSDAEVQQLTSFPGWVWALRNRKK